MYSIDLLEFNRKKKNLNLASNKYSVFYVKKRGGE